ncbi:MAG TPA: hypothetical protein VFS40_09190 [Gemmatimonadales bacterium]|nr:hypothetical protein [Gemmatimonadales bacterium]
MSRRFHSPLALATLSSLLTLTALAALPGRAAAQEARVFRPLPIDQLMSAGERQETGVLRLSPAERQALAAWVARHTAAALAADEGAQRMVKLARASTTVHLVAVPAALPPAAPARAAVPARGVRGAPDSTRGPLIVSAVPAASVFAWSVVGVRDGGRYVDLSDGTTWEVAPSDRPFASAWLTGQTVTVGTIGAPTGDFDRSLVNPESEPNLPTTRVVAARFAGITR